MINSPSTSSTPANTVSNEGARQSAILNVTDSSENLETKSHSSSDYENQKLKNKHLLALTRSEQKCECFGWFKGKNSGSKIKIKKDGLCFFRSVLLYETKDLDYAKIYNEDKVKADFTNNHNNELHSALNAALTGTHFNLLEKYYDNQNQLNPVFLIEFSKLLLTNLHLIWDPHSVLKLVKKALSRFEQELAPSEKTQIPISCSFIEANKEQAKLFSSLFFSNLVGHFDPTLFHLKNNHYSLSQKAEKEILELLKSNDH